MEGAIGVGNTIRYSSFDIPEVSFENSEVIVGRVVHLLTSQINNRANIWASYG